MKKIAILIIVLLLTIPVWGIIALLDSEPFDQLDISSIKTILTDTPDASNDMLCQAYIVLGSAADPLDGTGGAFEFVMTIGGQTVQPSPQIAIFGTEVRASIWTSQFLVPTGEAVIIQVTSPNAADTTIDVTAYLYDVFPVNTASGVIESDVQLIEGGDATDTIAAAVWDENVSGNVSANTFGGALDAVGTDINNRTYNSNLNALLGTTDSSGRTIRDDRRADVASELQDIGLDELMTNAIDGEHLSDVLHNESVMGHILASSDLANYDRTVHSAEVIGDGVVTLDGIIDAIKARWDALTTTGGYLETDMKNLDGTAVKSTSGNIHTLPGNI